jgi:hypothetical protein
MLVPFWLAFIHCGEASNEMSNQESHRGIVARVHNPNRRFHSFHNWLVPLVHHGAAKESRENEDKKKPRKPPFFSKKPSVPCESELLRLNYFFVIASRLISRFAFSNLRG